MPSKPDIILFSLFRWDSEISSSALALAKEFSKNHRVFYINHPFSLKDLFKSFSNKKVRKRMLSLLFGKYISEPIPANKDLWGITPKLTLPINFLNQGILYEFFAAINNKIINRTVRKIISHNSIENYLFLNCYNPYFFKNIYSKLKPSFYIYYSMDDISQASYTNRHGTRLEKEIILNYDFSLTTSMELLRLKQEISSTVYYLPNAADISLFLTALNSELSIPFDWIFNDQKTIGYIGAIESRIDYELLYQIAKSNEDKMIVLVGPIVTNEYKEHKLDKLKNVRLLGQKSYEDLPAYLRQMDIALIPFKKNKLTKSIYPRKINEYLAAGKAVVSTDFSEDIKAFKDVIYIGCNHADFVSKIDLAFKENNQIRIDQRIEVAKSNTWEARVKLFWKIRILL